MLSYGTPAAPNIVVKRIVLFLHDNQPGFSVRAPDVITPEWAAQAITTDFASPSANPPPPSSTKPGLERFMKSWLEVGDNTDGQTAVSQGASAFNDPTAVFSDLIAPQSGAGLFVDAGLARLRPDISPRGSFMLASLFCTPVVPPAELGAVSPPVGDFTRRQVIETETAEPQCRSCHAVVDPLGYSVEVLDPTTGAWTTTDAEGRPIDASGTFTSIGDAAFAQTYTFTSIQDLAPQLATSCEVARCFATSYVNEATTTLDLPALQGDELEFVITQFSESNFSLQALVRAFVQTPTFLQ